MENIPQSSCHRFTKINNGFSKVESDDLILVSDSGCDQSIITSLWMTIHTTERHIVKTGPFADPNIGLQFHVVSAIPKIFDRDGNAYTAEIYKSLLDKSDHQKKLILVSHQDLLNTYIDIDDHSMHERHINKIPDTQPARFQKHLLTFHFDGVTCFFIVKPITEEEIKDLAWILLSLP